MTSEKQKRVFVVSGNSRDITQQYVYQIEEIKVTKDRYVFYHLRYDKSEANKKRKSFWLPQ